MVSNIGPLGPVANMISTVSSTGKQYVPVKPNPVRLFTVQSMFPVFPHRAVSREFLLTGW